MLHLSSIFRCHISPYGTKKSIFEGTLHQNRRKCRYIKDLRHGGGWRALHIKLFVGTQRQRCQSPIPMAHENLNQF